MYTHTIVHIGEGEHRQTWTLSTEYSLSFGSRKRFTILDR